MLGLTKAQVAAVATFYTMYKRTPTGEYLVSVCTNTLCGMLGGDEIFGALKRARSASANNETTADGTITLEHAECLAACDYAPVVTVNYEFFDNQTRRVGARELVSQLRAGERPAPTRGAPLCTFRQIERQIAGFFDDAALAPRRQRQRRARPRSASKLAIERGDTAPSYAARGTTGRVTPSGDASRAHRAGAADERARRTADRPRSPTTRTTEPGAAEGRLSDPHPGPHQAVRHRPAVEDRQLRAAGRLRRAAQGAEHAARGARSRWSRTPTCAAAAGPASRPA